MDNDEKKSPAFWMALVALAFATIASATTARNFDEFKDPLNLLMLAGVGLIFYAAAEFVLSLLRWYYIQTPYAGIDQARGHTDRQILIESRTEPEEATAVAPATAVSPEESPLTRFEKRFVLDYNEADETARLRIFERVVTVSYRQLDHLSDIFDARLNGDLPNVSRRKIDKATNLTRGSSETEELIEFLLVNGLIDKAGQVYVWTRSGEKMFPPTLARGSVSGFSGGGSRVATTASQPPPRSTTFATTPSH